MGLASDMRDRITLERLIESASGAHSWSVVDTVSAAVEPQGEATYRLRIRYRDDLRSRADLEPAMRVKYLGDYLDLNDVVETVRHTELQISASRRFVDDITDLGSAARRIKNA
jgi:hypothetical protein